ncbi:predicted protein [Postia placenta Mad-698-R]|nr:predicted protein [Postia placenta Mad-698-R]
MELYERLEKGDNQLTYYSSGMGPFVNPSKKMTAGLLKLKIDNVFETAVVVFVLYAGHLAHMEACQYHIGSSNGAYEARVLAAMIDTVGLVFPDNEEQVPLAYELYAASKDAPGDRYTQFNASRVHHVNPINRTSCFKENFSRRDVKVHFVGAWDTISSGLFRGLKELPKTRATEHICYFRHALALDERRVRFSLEDIVRPASISPSLPPSQPLSPIHEATPQENDTVLESNVTVGHDQVNPGNRTNDRVKEVWFAGTHIDVSGGGSPHKEARQSDLNSVLWMATEALAKGLVVDVHKEPKDASGASTTSKMPLDSLTGAWWLLELVPFIRRRTESDTGLKALFVACAPHFGARRVIRPGQRIHRSAATMVAKDYHPQAAWPSSGDSTLPGTWQQIGDYISKKNGDHGALNFDHLIEGEPASQSEP